MIYLDHAATSWPKPAVVVSACQRWLTEVGVSADRGDGPQTREAREVVQRVRRGIAAMTGHDPDHVALCSGATEGLNLVLRALLSNRRRVTTTSLEHSSVVRPLLAPQAQGEASVPAAGQDPGAVRPAHGEGLAAHAPPAPRRVRRLPRRPDGRAHPRRSLMESPGPTPRA